MPSRTSAPSSPQPIVFIVPGTDTRGASRGGAAAATDPPSDGRWDVRHSVAVATRRGGTPVHEVSAVPELDVVRIRIAGGPELLLHPENARDLLLACGDPAQTPKRGSAAGAAAAVDPAAKIAVPAELRWQGLEAAAPTRGGGFLGKVLVSVFEVLRPHAHTAAVDFAKDLAVAKLDGKVRAGVYALTPQSLDAFVPSGQQPLQAVPLPAQGAAQPILVLVHGTFVDTVSTFGKLWKQHSGRVANLFEHYGAGNVYALDHPTLSASPLANALTLVRTLPTGARLHLVTHSRGGLVAECLARVCGMVRAGVDKVAPAELAYFVGDGYQVHRQELQALYTEVRLRQVSVGRIVRVACPARGTLLASGRLDAYLSVLRWSLGAAGVPVVPELVDFLAEVARRRARPGELPGLEAMIPDTPFVRWLNEPPEAIEGDLRVIAGDLQGDSVGSFLKTLLADAYYWSDNDIVVQTRSMYGGTPRQAGASFLLDQGGNVNHFNYFANERTAQAVVDALMLAGAAPGFHTIGPLSWAGEDSSGSRAARARQSRGSATAAPAGTLPAVFVLPGILGSNLKVGDKRIWLSLRLVGGLSKLAYKAGARDGVLPDEPVGMVYDDLIEHLQATHEVLPFAFDWRRPIEEEALRLAAAVDQALDVRRGSGQPVRLLAHSMGGVVARTMQIVAPTTWTRLMAHAGARLVMLGTPNAGSWAPMQVLSGDDTFGNALAAFGSPFANQQARQLMAEMPGFLQLQADLRDPVRALARSSSWRALADADAKASEAANWWHHSQGEAIEPAYAWGVPGDDVLAAAVALREKLDSQRERELPAWAAKLLLVVGRARFTPDGYTQDASGAFVYLDAVDGGDGRVPHHSAVLPGVATWAMDCEHGTMPDAASAFDAFTELLERGSTDKLQRFELPSRGGRGAGGADGAADPAQHRRSRPSRQALNPVPAGDELDVFRSPGSVADARPDVVRGAALRLRLLNGNLSFVGQPLMVGHTRSLALSGSEGAVDGLLGGAMKAALEAGLYPDLPGSAQIFENRQPPAKNPLAVPFPRAVIVLGLGEEGKLDENALRTTARQGTLAWLHRASEARVAVGPTVELAVTLMGSGGLGMNASNAARAIALGVAEANERAADGWPRVSLLVFVELYLERASDAWNGLKVLVEAAPERFVVEPLIHAGVGALRRQVDSGYRGADYDIIAATSAGNDAIAFTLDTRRARTEVTAQITQGKLLRELVRRASTDRNTDERLGRSLFQLLVPVEVEPFLAGNSRMQLDLDKTTAPIPWELLDTRRDPRSNDLPWAIRTKLLRKLRTDTFRAQVDDAGSSDAMLVIGQPHVDTLEDDGTPRYGPLPGARTEAEGVVRVLAAASWLDASKVISVIGDGRMPAPGVESAANAASVINALFARRYRIVHVAAHGEPVVLNPDHTEKSPGGVVLSGGTFLSAKEIRSMRTVPQLVFVNCCHTANEGRGALQGARSHDRAEFAAGLAASLIEIGVRCVVAAGWAVSDGAAARFAEVFYQQLLDKKPFIDAVASARAAIYQGDSSDNTWAAYQCYGDPNWTLTEDQQRSTRAEPPVAEEFAGVASPLGLTLALEMVEVQTQWMHAKPARQAEKLRHLVQRFGNEWGAMGCVAEAFGMAFAALNDHDEAVRWYEQAVVASDRSASVRALEQLCNQRARSAWAAVRNGAVAEPAAGAAGGAAAAPGGAKPPTPTALRAAARRTISRALRELAALRRVGDSLERAALVGSAQKRLVLVERDAGNRRAERAALVASQKAYGDATRLLGPAAADTARFYPLQNRIEGTWALALHDARGTLPSAPQQEIAEARALIEQARQTQPHFWVYASSSGLDMFEAAAAGSLAAKAPELARSWSETHQRVSSPQKWASVADQAEFLLGPLAQRKDLKVADAERRAARSLIDVLAGFAKAAR